MDMIVQAMIAICGVTAVYLSQDMRLDYRRLQFSHRNTLPGGFLEQVLPADQFISQFSGKVFGEFDAETLTAAGDTDNVHRSLVQLKCHSCRRENYIR